MDARGIGFVFGPEESHDLVAEIFRDGSAIAADENKISIEENGIPEFGLGLRVGRERIGVLQAETFLLEIEQLFFGSVMEQFPNFSKRQTLVLEEADGLELEKMFFSERLFLVGSGRIDQVDGAVVAKSAFGEKFGGLAIGWNEMIFGAPTIDLTDEILERKSEIHNAGMLTIKQCYCQH